MEEKLEVTLCNGPEAMSIYATLMVDKPTFNARCSSMLKEYNGVFWEFRYLADRPLYIHKDCVRMMHKEEAWKKQHCYDIRDAFYTMLEKEFAPWNRSMIPVIEM